MKQIHAMSLQILNQEPDRFKDCRCEELERENEALRQELDGVLKMIGDIPPAEGKETIHISELPDGYKSYICIECDESFVRRDIPIRHPYSVTCPECQKKIKED